MYVCCLYTTSGKQQTITRFTCMRVLACGTDALLCFCVAGGNHISQCWETFFKNKTNERSALPPKKDDIIGVV